MHPYPGRRDRLASRATAEGLDGFLVTNPVNVSYLTGFSGDSSYLLVSPRRTVLVSDGRYVEQLQQECADLEASIRPPSVRITPATAQVIQSLGWRRVGFESGHLTVAEFERFRADVPTASWKPVEDAVERVRVRKDESEVAQLRQAIAIAEAAFAQFRGSLGSEDTEKKLTDRIETLVRECGGRCCSFPAIIGVDERAALPHAPPTDKTLAGGSLLLVDWGASGRFYKSDLTRVLALRKISPKFEQVYGVVLRAQARAVSRIRPGVKASDVDAEARLVFEEAGFGSFFSHGLGHGIGLEVHEAPGLRPQSETSLEPGMVVTVEPGLYFPGWGGIRIEDDVLVTPDGCEVLTSVPKDLASVVVDLG
jgi:Xaa-Pro aminopeptidase